jgi:DNA modification methylase
MKQIDGESVDLIITDPPYNLGNFMRGRQTNLKQMRENFFGAAGWDDLAYDEWAEQMDRFFAEAHRVTKKKGAMVMFMSLMKVETVVKIAAKHHFYYKTTGVWHKRNPMPRNMNLHFINSVEGWIYLINDGKTGTFNNNNKALHDFIETSVSPAGEKGHGKHPTQKPEGLIQHFVEVLTNPGDVVLDPFMGSGTAGVVSKRLGRPFIGIELDPHYYEFAKQRIDSVTE